MKKLLIVLGAMVCAGLWATVVVAEETADQENESSSWMEMLSVYGMVDARVGYRQVTPEADDYDTETTGDIYIYGAGMGVAAKINDYLSGFAFIVFEEEFGGADLDLYMDEGAVRFNWNGMFATIGKLYLPVGRFDTYAVSDPLVLELAECRQSTIGLGYEHPYFTVSAWGFAGDFDNVDEGGEAEDNTIDAFAGAVEVMPLAFQDRFTLSLGGYLLTDATETSLAMGESLNEFNPDGVLDNGDEFIRYENNVPLYGGFLSAEFPITEMFGLGIVGEYATTGEFDEEEYLDNTGEATAISAANGELAVLLLDGAVQFGPKFEMISGLDWLETQDNDEEYEVTRYTQYGGFVGFNPWEHLHLGLQVMAGADNEENQVLDSVFQTALEF